MQFQLDQMKRMIYGAKRERFVKNINENQMKLPFDVEPKKQQETIAYTRSKTKRKNRSGRM
jgi:hypothetical protein